MGAVLHHGVDTGVLCGVLHHCTQHTGIESEPALCASDCSTARRRADASDSRVPYLQALSYPFLLGQASEARLGLDNHVGTKAARVPVSIVIPCYNEELALPYLANTLRSVEEQLSPNYDLRFIFVDDCSRDNTWACLQKLFGAQPNHTLLRHAQNSGVAAGILTGLRAAPTEIVCSMDCDCTYDPHELARIIPLLTADTAMVTASPYHPQGAVRNVPKWRLSLSHGASWLYRRILRQPLYTYTSCFRVYRRSLVETVQVNEPGFLGVAEMLGKLDLSGARIVEYPATLEVRLFGESKMKVGRTIVGHLKLMSRLVNLRLRGSLSPSPVQSLKPPETERLGRS